MLTIYVLSIRFYHPDNLFVFGNKIIFFSCFIFLLVGFFVLKNKLVFTVFSYNILTYCLVCYAFHVTLPVTVDRSLSVLLLSTIKSNPNISLENTEKKIIDGFLDGDSFFCKRINEQLSIKNITIDNNLLQLTQKGKKTLDIMTTVGKVLDLNAYYVSSAKNREHYESFVMERGVCVKVKD
jgi:hypothetical protein